MALDIYQSVTDKLIASIEAGAVPWVKPWRTIKTAGGTGSALPMNGATGRSYSGINTVILWAAAMERGFASNDWYTFNQARDLGAGVRKGAKAEHVTFWKKLTIMDDDGKGGKEEKKIPMVKTYCVFNREEIEGLPGVTPIPDAPDGAHLAIVNALKLGGGLVHGGDSACYMPAMDRISMPRPDAFTSTDGYVATLMHEATHATGAKTRLDRDLSGRFGSDRYAMEELVAELGSAFLCARLGVDGDLRHAAYLDNWLKVLKADKKAIFAASAQARTAAEYLTRGAGMDAAEEGEAAAAK